MRHCLEGRGATGVARSSTRLLTYVLSWMTAGAIATAVALTLLRGGDSHERPPAIALPALREITFVDAIRKSRCRLERLSRGSPLRAASARTRAATPAIYDTPLRSPALGAAVRRGIIVIQYRPVLAAVRVQQLRQLQRVVQRGTVLAPSGVATSDALVVASYRRVLRCPEATDTALNAVRLFRGRFVGTGPQR